MNKDLQRYEEALSKLKEERNKLQERIDCGTKAVNAMREAEECRIREEAKNKIKPEVWNSWLLKLAKSMEFKGIFHGDLVSIGADGKRPFGSSSWDYGVPEILEWNEEEISESKINKLISALLEELPDFINDLIQKQ